MTARYYVRCVDCLAVGCVERPDFSPPPTGKCPCGGRVESMGRVTRGGRLVADYRDSACDWNCTSARGPRCDCKCRAENHGKGVTIAITVDLGGVPRYSLEPDMTRGTAYREAVAAAEARIVHLNRGDVVARKLRGEFLGAADFATYRAVGEAHRELSRIRAMRSHKARLNALARVAAQAVA